MGRGRDKKMGEFWSEKLKRGLLGRPRHKYEDSFKTKSIIFWDDAVLLLLLVGWD
jgi:hypothetical protein